MNQQVSELRNVFVGFSQKIGNLEKKIDLALEKSQRAQEYGELARDISLRHLQGDLQQLEIETIRKLFSGSSPSLDEIILDEPEGCLNLGISEIFQDEPTGDTTKKLDKDSQDDGSKSHDSQDDGSKSHDSQDEGQEKPKIDEGDNIKD